jgi:hypothetical protein
MQTAVQIVTPIVPRATKPTKSNITKLKIFLSKNGKSGQNTK